MFANTYTCNTQKYINTLCLAAVRMSPCTQFANFDHIIIDNVYIYIFIYLYNIANQKKDEKHHSITVLVGVVLFTFFWGCNIRIQCSICKSSKGIVFFEESSRLVVG